MMRVISIAQLLPRVTVSDIFVTLVDDTINCHYQQSLHLEIWLPCNFQSLNSYKESNRMMVEPYFWPHIAK